MGILVKSLMSMLATDRAVQWAGGSQPELVLSVSGDLFGTDFQGAAWLDANLSEEAQCFSITCSTERCGPVAALPSPRTRRPSGDRAWQPRRVPARGEPRDEGQDGGQGGPSARLTCTNPQVLHQREG